MPRKKKTSKKISVGLRNIARGQQGSIFSATVLKELTPRDELARTAYWFSHAFPLGKMNKYILPKKPSSLPGVSVGHATDIEREVIWSTALLQSKFYQLRKYLCQKKIIERCLGEGEYKAAELELDKLTNRISWSHSFLALKLFLLSENEGLESQKDWIFENVLRITNSPAAFFSYWLGVRQETGRDPRDFENYLTQTIPSLYTTGEDDGFLQHILMARQASEKDEANLIQQLQTQSIIDMYEGLVSHFVTAACEARKSLKFYIQHLLPLMENLDDIRASKVKAILNDEEKFFEILNNKGWSASSFLNKMREGENPNIDNAPKIYADGIFAATDFKKTDRENRSLLGSLAYADVWNDMCAFLRATYQLRSATKVHEVVMLNRARFIYDVKPCPYLTGYIEGNELKNKYLDFYNLHGKDCKYFQISNFIVNGQYGCAKDLLADVAAERGHEDPEFLRTEIILSLEISDYSHMIERLYQALDKHKECLSWLPYQDISMALDDSVIEKFSISPKLSIVLSHLAIMIGERVRSQLVYSSELYLQNQGLTKPSEICENDIRENKTVQEFLLLCFTPETMALSLSYEDAEEMQEERLRHLSILAGVVERVKERCENEIEQIIRSQEISRAMSTVAESKINCDETELFFWAKEKLSSKYERFRSFVEAGILPAPADASRDLLVAVREGDVGNKTFEIPSNEATSILREITSELIRVYSFDPYFGLNSYLSLRVRHGTISGQLRRGSAEEKLLTTADSDGDHYEVNQHWLDILKENAGPEQAIQVATQLSEFSKSFDTLISGFSEENLQIISEEKPKGLVVTSFYETTLFGFFSDAINYETFDEFLDGFSVAFWANLEVTLETTRAYINKEFRKKVMSLFDKLEEYIQSIAKAPSLPPVSDAIVRARNSTNQSIDEISNWFFASQSSESTPFSIPDLGRISLEIAKRLDPSFTPDVQFLEGVDFSITSDLITFTDIFGVLFDNVAKHSGYKSPQVRISYDVISDDTLRVRFSSQCCNIERAKNAAEAANANFTGGDYSSALTAEGGTGLAKISKIMLGSQSDKPFFVSVDEEDFTFDVHLEFSYLDLGALGYKKNDDI